MAHIQMKVHMVTPTAVLDLDNLRQFVTATQVMSSAAEVTVIRVGEHVSVTATWERD